MIIYKILNKINGKAYIGQTVQSLQGRLRHHLSDASGCRALKSAIKKYGLDAFEVQELAKAESLEQLNVLEIEFIEKLGTIAPGGYNLKEGGNRPKYSEESRKRMSEARRGKKQNLKPEQRARRAEITRAFWTGRERSSKQRRELSERMKGKYVGEKHPMFGKRQSSEARSKMRAAKIGYTPWNKGLKADPAHVKRASESKKITYKVTGPDGVFCFLRGAAEVAIKIGVSKGSVLGRMSSHDGRYQFGDYLVERAQK